MKTMGRPGNPHDRQHSQNRVNQSKHRLKGRISLVALGCAALATSLTIPVTLAQSGTGPEVTLGSEVTPGDAEAIAAVVEAMPLASATMLDALSDAARAEVERICLPVQYQSGAVAYHECISEQLDGQPSASTATVPATSLSFDEEYAIQQACKDAGRVDSAAYLACDEAQLASLAGVPEPTLDRITEDETYAIQLGCYDSQTNDGVRAYRECLNASIAQLLALPRPDLSTLALVERNALQLRCSAQNTSAVAYRNCLLDAVNGATLANRTVDSPIDAPAIENDIELSPEPLIEPSGQAAPQTDDTADLEFVAASEDLQPAPVTDSETPAITTPVVEADPTVTPQATRLPTADNLNQSDSSEDADAESDAPEEAEDPGQTPADLLARVRTTFTGMNDMTRMIMWTAIGLPILLTLFWLLMRGRESAPESEASYSENPITNGIDMAPHRSSSTHPMRMTNDDTAGFAQQNRATRQQDSSAQTDEDELNFAAQMDELFGKSAPESATTANKITTVGNSRNLDITPDVLLTEPPTRESQPTTPELVSSREAQTESDRASSRKPYTTAEPASSQEPEIAEENLSTSDLAYDPELDSDSGQPSAKTPVSELPAFTDFTLAPATERDDYLAWLSVQDEAKQQTLAIEFLIYWMAYSDERYPPELKKIILELQNPGDHELIKRWTLKQDVHAFAGNLQWLQYNLSTEQHEQIINLLMALLVSENALTPAQNTLLRFLADAFGLGAQRLDTLFQTGFAHPMPSLPELDNPDWWKRQSSDKLKRWDARSVSRQRSDIRYRVALGLPLGVELDSQAIMASFKRASKRCQPERFNRLSLREQNLVAKQLEKYEIAAESLLEVSA